MGAGIWVVKTAFVPPHERLASPSERLLLTRGCEGTWECQVGWHLSAVIVLSSLSVSHSGECGLCSQDAQLPHGGLFIVVWRRCLTSVPGKTLSWRHLSPTDAVATETGLCWHHRIWSNRPWRTNPQHDHHLISWGFTRRCPVVGLLTAVKRCVLKHNYAQARGEDVVICVPEYVFFVSLLLLHC